MEQIVVGLLVWIILQIQLLVSTKGYIKAKELHYKVQHVYFKAILLGIIACSINFISIILALYNLALYIAIWGFSISIVLTFINSIILTFWTIEV
jgi:hypothetical protein